MPDLCAFIERGRGEAHEVDAPRCQFEQAEVFMLDVDEIVRGVKAQRRGCGLEHLPNTLFHLKVIDPFREAVGVNGIHHVGSISQRHVRVLGKVTRFVGIAMCANPSRCAFPDRVKDARTWALFFVNGRHAAPDHLIHARDKLGFDLGKVVDPHEVAFQLIRKMNQKTA
jgi:hypothetical protein